MKTYRPTSPPNDPAQLPGFLRLEFAAIHKAAIRPDPFVEMEVLHAEPEKVRAGIYVTADGVDWDPGSGEGLYRRDKTNTSWVFIG